MEFINHKWQHVVTLANTEAQGRYAIKETQLLTDFLSDHANAKHPVATVAEVKPLILTAEQIDSLLVSLEAYLA
jgi:hypothetical protein